MITPCWHEAGKELVIGGSGAQDGDPRSCAVLAWACDMVMVGDPVGAWRKRAAGVLALFAVTAGSCLLPSAEKAAEGQSDGGLEAAPQDGVGNDVEAEAAGLPGFGEPCTAEQRCREGLKCGSAWGSVDPLVMSGSRVPICLAECSTPDDFCNQADGTQGYCVVTSPTTSPVCIRVCTPLSEAGACPVGLECLVIPEIPSSGFCVARCRNHDECQAAVAGKLCGPNGLCVPVVPSDPTAPCSLNTPCSCYPNPVENGTCAIACDTSTPCPKHSPSGTQMVCPDLSDAKHPAFSYCMLPCGGDAAAICETVGLICSPQWKVNQVPVCDSE